MIQDLFATVAGYAACTGKLTSRLIQKIRSRVSRLPSIHWGRHYARVAGPAVILFPYSANRLCCGLAGIIAVKGRTGRNMAIDLSSLATLVDIADAAGLETQSTQMDAIADGYLGGQHRTACCQKSGPSSKRRRFSPCSRTRPRRKRSPVCPADCRRFC
jgi:hypothetical protein